MGQSTELIAMVQKTGQRPGIGAEGEQLAAAFLVNHGFQILDTNYRTRTGEIDIIAEGHGFLVFVEVKTRRSNVYGTPAEAVTRKKQQKIVSAALDYLEKTHSQGKSQCFRFDVLEVEVDRKGTVKYNHIINAFGR